MSLSRSPWAWPSRPSSPPPRVGASRAALPRPRPAPPFRVPKYRSSGPTSARVLTRMGGSHCSTFRLARTTSASSIGYKLGTLRLVVRSDTVNSADAQLTPSVLELDAVVVTGTAGVARVREVGNSIAKVNLAEVKDPPANMDQLLQARAPGLSVMQTSGMAGE